MPEFYFSGIIKQGLGKAAEVLKHVFPAMEQDFPEIEDFQEGTINVQLHEPIWEFPIARVSPVFVRKLPGGIELPEVFAFSRILFRIGDGDPIKAVIYWSFSSPHRHDRRMVEIMAPPIPGLQHGTKCSIEILWPQD